VTAVGDHGADLPGAVWVEGGTALTGEVSTPGDKSVSHRALILAALAEGTSRLRGLSDGDDVARTRQAVEDLGAEVVDDDGAVVVTGGRERLHPPPSPLDCGNSGTGMRLLAGVVAALPGTTVLVGDESLSSRPMDRVAEPLRAMGATVTGRGDRCLPPVTVTGGGLHGIEWRPPVASAQVKSAVLLAGVLSEGETVVHEPVATRAHTEEMLAATGADVVVEADGGGRTVRVRRSSLVPFSLDVPGDPSQAAFWLVAACLVPGSAVTVRRVYAGPERIGFVHVLERMGAHVAVVPSEAGSSTGTVTADLVARAGPLRSTVVDGAEIPSLDEVPVLAVAAAVAEGTTVFRQMGELRVKESDRLDAVVRLLGAIGVASDVVGDDLHVHGVGPDGHLCHAATYSGGDHRMAMAAAVAALAAGPGRSRVGGFACVGTSYPGFLAALGSLGGRTIPGAAGGPLVAIDGPAGSGKSTVSAALSARLGVHRLDSGAMYRAVAWAALDRGIDRADAGALALIARDADIVVGADGVGIDGVDITAAIRSPEVSAAVSQVAATPEVRRHLVDRQRRWAGEHRGGVVEGRDIGSVVFPDADVRVYLTASADERARRRAEESPEGLARRDHIDSTRATSPLPEASRAAADGAVVIDTTDRTVDDVVEEVIRWM
jgi:3-phosphoshikimate 1-carboxyvinyltransferase